MKMKEMNKKDAEEGEGEKHRLEYENDKNPLKSFPCCMNETKLVFLFVYVCQVFLHHKFLFLFGLLHVVFVFVLFFLFFFKSCCCT